jgi:hypothetical protein
MIWALALILAIGHFLYACQVGLLLYKLTGGIIESPGGWTGYGGAKYAWTIPLYIPAVALCQTRLAPLGGILILLVPVLTAYAASALAFDAVTLRKVSFGPARWRLVTLVLGLLWIPVPETLSYVYTYTVLY